MAEQTATERQSHILSSTYGLTVLAFLVILVSDQLTKALIVDRFAVGDSVEIIPGMFNLCHARNSGVVFGLFPGISWLFAVLTAVAIILLVVLVRSLEETASRLQYLAYGLIIGGAVGNLIDRLRFGTVTDFLDFYIGTHHWPAFNVADSAVCTGVAILLVTTLIASWRDRSDAAS